MPAKTTQPKAKKQSTPKPKSGNVYNIEGGIHVGRDYIAGDQKNVYYQTQQTFNITSPTQFVDELQKLKEEIEKLKSQPDVQPAAVSRLDAVAGNIEDAIGEAGKEKPLAERIKSTLDGAKETMDKLGGSIASAVNLGTALGNLALLAMKVFGG